ncbi:lytic transglycosylase F [Ancylobacter sonchi]|nr:lytic transglycosylase F [Ancylobacter sonchi]
MGLSVVLLALGWLPMAALAQGVTSGPGFRGWAGDLDGMEKRRLIRILVPYSKTIYFIDRGRQLGTAVEFGQALETQINRGRKKEVERMRVAFVPTARDQLIPALIAGRGDIVAANLTITPERQVLVDFTDPLATGVSEILVTGPSAPAIATLDDLAGKTVPLRKSSSYFTHVSALNERLKREGKPEVIIQPIDESLEDEDLLEMVNAGLLPWTIVDRHKAEIWATTFEHVTLRDDIAVAEGGAIAWAIRKDSPKLAALLDAFVAGHKVGTGFGNMLKKRYYQNDKMVRAAYDRGELEKFEALVVLFAQYGKSYAFDELLLAAQGYQESQLDQSRRSPRGAVGIMQLLPSTAADKAVGIAGIDKSAERNIEAGAKYLNYLSTRYVDDPALTPINRMLFTIAAYNAGPGNLRKFRREASRMGLDPNVWFGNVENGAAKIVGRETVQYVGNIYKYYIAYKLYFERRNGAPSAATATTN